MSASFTRRILAYLIDLFLLGFIIVSIYQFIPESKKETALQTDIAILNENYLNKQITTGEYLKDYSILMYQLDRSRLSLPIINFILIFLYFVIYPYMTHGQTIGKFIMKIKIQSKKEKLSILSLFLRNLIVTGLGYLILSTLALLIVSKNIYLSTITILGIIQFGLVIVSAFMIIYSKERKGLEDMLSGTIVINK